MPRPSLIAARPAGRKRWSLGPLSLLRPMRNGARAPSNVGSQFVAHASRSLLMYIRRLQNTSMMRCWARVWANDFRMGKGQSLVNHMEAPVINAVHNLATGLTAVPCYCCPTVNVSRHDGLAFSQTRTFTCRRRLQLTRRDECP